jgi:hypothetical protein
LAVIVLLALAPAAHAATMRLTQVTVDKRSVISDTQWDIPVNGGTVAWRAPDDTSTYTFNVPSAIPAGGASFTITVTAEARRNAFGHGTRWAPAMSVSGAIVSPGGRVQVSALADSESKATDSQSATVTLTPVAGQSTVTVGIQDGPVYSFIFQGTADCNGRIAGRVAQTQTPQPGCEPVRPISSTSKQPQLGQTTTYRAPPPGKSVGVPLPKIGRDSTELGALINFVDDKGNPLPRPPLAALDAIYERAERICFLMLWTEYDEEDNSVSGVDFLTCSVTVAKVLIRAEQLRRQRQQPLSARAAQRACAARTLRRKARARLRVSCARTATGVKLTIRPRSSKQTLKSALAGAKLKLIVGRGGAGAASAGDRLNVRWTARRAPGLL